MHSRTFLPPKGLQSLVRFGWTLDSLTEGSAPHRLLAESCPNIVVIQHGSFTEADGSRAADIHLAGALSRATGNTGHGPFKLFGIYLWPWAVRVFFGLEPVETQDRFISLEECVSPEEQSRLINASDPHGAMDVAAAWLFRIRKEVERDPLPETLVRRMIEAHGSGQLDPYITNSGLARRQFERRFKACTGFSPALFQRILRFQYTYRLIERGVARNLTEVALEAGYFDQSHFIRDFKRFSGLDPKAYFRKVPEKVDNFVRLA